MRSARSLSACASTRTTFSPILCIELLASRAAFSNIFLDNFLPFTLSFEDEFNRVPQSAVASALLGHVVGVTLYLVPSIRHRNSQTTVPHHRLIDDVVADE